MEDDNKSASPQRLDNNSFVSISLVVLLLGGVWGLSSILHGDKESQSASFSELERLLVEQQHALELQKVTIEAKLETLTSAARDNWTGNDMFRWAAALQHDNPEIKVPEPSVK